MPIINSSAIINPSASDDERPQHHQDDVTQKDTDDPLSEPLLPHGTSTTSSATSSSARQGQRRRRGGDEPARHGRGTTKPMITFQEDVLDEDELNKQRGSSLFLPSVPPPSAFSSVRDVRAEIDDLDDDDLDGDGGEDTKDPWPELARTARFLLDPTTFTAPKIVGVADAAREAADIAASSSAHHDTNVEDRRSVCRLSYREETSRIEVLDCTPDDYGTCLGSFDPSDVIGAKLQIHLHAPDLTDLGDDEDDDEDGSGEGDGGQEFFDAVSGEGEGTHDERAGAGVRGRRRRRRRGDAGSRAFLNVWHYPRMPRQESGWCRLSSLFSSSSSSSKAEAGAAPSPESASPSGARSPAGEGAAGNPSEGQSATGKEEEPLGRHPRHLVLELVTCEDLADARCCVRSIRRLADLHPSRHLHGMDDDHHGGTPRPVPGSGPRRYLVVLNPYSGVGRAMEVYDSTVRIMLDQSGVEHDLFVTERGGHATERMLDRRRRPRPRRGRPKVDGTDGTSNGVRDEEGNPLVVLEGEEYGDAREGGHDDHHHHGHHLLGDDDGLDDRDLTEYDAVVAMGGDGILFEVLQGVRRRDDSRDVLDRIAFGVVGCGTSNGMAKSLLHEGGEKYGALESTFQICRGATSPVDLSVCETMTAEGDDAAHGEAAQTSSVMAEAAAATNTRSYYGFLTFSYGLIADVDLESECIHFLGSIRNDIWAVWRILTMRTYSCRFTYLPPPAGAVVLPPLSEPIPVGGTCGGGSAGSDPAWEVMEGDVVCFWACQVSHAAFNLHNSPRSKLSDGLFRVLLVRTPCSRLKLIRMFLQMEGGGHVGIDGLEMIDCVAFRLEPLGEGRRSYNDLDGEEIEAGSVQGRVLPSAARFFSS